MRGKAKPIRMEEAIKILSNKKQVHGLCLSCANAPECTYARDPDRPVLQCEECDPGTFYTLTVSAHSFSPRVVPSSPSEHLTEEQNPGRYKGLCSLCEDCPTCTYPKPEGGVWHCEEYR